MPTGPLGALSHDEVGVVVQALADPLEAHIAVALASTCCGLRAPTAEMLAELKRQAIAVRQLCERLNCNFSSLRGVTKISVLEGHCEIVGKLLGNDCLTELEEIFMCYNHSAAADDSLTRVFAGLTSGALPKLRRLALGCSGISNAGASVLAAAFRRGAMPNLKTLDLGINHMTSAGLVALVPSLPSLTTLGVDTNRIDDQGLANFLVVPPTGVLASLRRLYLSGNGELSDAGLNALIDGLDAGALPALVCCNLRDTGASPATHARMRKALQQRGADDLWWA